MMKKTILIDLDGVLNDYSGNYNENKIPNIKKGAKEFLKDLAINYNIEIFTVRNRMQTVKWLQNNKIDNLIKDVTNVKNPYASVIIDDRAINFNGNFKELSDKIKDFKPYWK